MRNRLRWPAFAIIAVLLVGACSGATSSAAPSSGESAAPPASQPAEPSESAQAAAPTPEPAADCAQSADPNAMQMWERSGGNKGMVDQLVCDWNTANPGKPINLSYIPHAEMVGKIAQGIASGDVPDLMGMDLIYAPQFENAGQLVDLTDMIGDWPELETASPGHMTVATFNERL